MTRPILLLDMDGPLADFDAAFWHHCIERNITFDIDCPTKQRHRFFTEHIPNRGERADARDLVDTAGWFRDLPVTPGASEGVPELIERFDVWVCTKPLVANPTCVNDKQGWLTRHFPALRDRLITAPNKAMIRGDVLLDDAPKPEWLPVADWVPVIFKAPYNDAAPWSGLPRWTWGDPVEQLVDIVRSRRE